MPETKERQIAFKFILKLRVRYMGKCHITIFIPCSGSKKCRDLHIVRERGTEGEKFIAFREDLTDRSIFSDKKQ